MENQWSLSKKIGFLFLFFYFSFYATSLTLFIEIFFTPIWSKIVIGLAHLLGYEGKMNLSYTGSGDSIYHYYQIGFFFIISILAAFIVAFFDRQRKNYQSLLTWLTIILRFSLAYSMLIYGFAKVFYLQFQFPNATKLEQPIGQLSPMGLLWTFMGYSKSYCIFTGALEVVAGLFLINKKTVTLGALTTFGVMLNVMMLNYCYDVPLKLFSTHIVVMSTILIILDGNRLLHFFFTNKNVEPLLYKNIFPDKFKKIKILLKSSVIMFALGLNLWSYFMFQSIREKNPNANLSFKNQFMIENFEEFKLSEGSMKKNNSLKWKTLSLKDNEQAVIKTYDHYNLNYNFTKDTDRKIISINFTELNYDSLSPKHFRVYGNFGTDSLSFELIKEEYPLAERAFHWIIEYPHNR